MTDAIVNAVVAAVSFLFGAGLTRWWNRARPLVLLRGFSVIYSNRDDIEWSDDMETLTRDFWEGPTIESGKVELGDVQRVRRGILLIRASYKPCLDSLDDFVSSLQEAENDEQIMSVLLKHITEATTELPLNLALCRGDVRVEFSPPDEPPKLPIHESKKHDGCYVIVWKGATSTFARNMEEQSYLKPRLEPFI